MYNNKNKNSCSSKCVVMPFSSDAASLRVTLTLGAASQAHTLMEALPRAQLNLWLNLVL